MPNLIATKNHSAAYNPEFYTTADKEISHLMALGTTYGQSNTDGYEPYDDPAGSFQKRILRTASAEIISCAVSSVKSRFPRLKGKSLRDLLIATSDQQLNLRGYTQSKGSVNAIRATLARSGGGQTFHGDFAPRRDAVQPRVYSDYQTIFDYQKNAIMLFGGRRILDYAHNQVRQSSDDIFWFKDDQWQLETSVDSSKTVEAPGKTNGHALAYDSWRNLTVMKGVHSNRIYEFDRNNWNRKWSSAYPPTTNWPALAFDSSRGVCVLYGGSDLPARQSTWEYDGTEWTQIRTQNAPPQLGESSMVYDPFNQRMILFGGDLKNHDNFNETWSYDGINWTQLDVHGPVTQQVPQLFYDSQNKRIVLFSGNNGPHAGDFNEIWQLTDDDGWQLLNSNMPAKYDLSQKIVAFDPVKNQFVLNNHYEYNANKDEVTGTTWIFSDFTPAHWIDHLASGANDYSGDGAADLATWTPGKTGSWNVQGQKATEIGTWGDEPVPGDYNGDGKAEAAVYRRETGHWIFAGGKKKKFGDFDAIPMPADYDGDGKTDLAYYDKYSATVIIKGQRNRTIGKPGLIPVVADFNGDGAAEVASWSPFDCSWTIEGESEQITFGTPITKENQTGCSPVTGDFDGDGRDEPALWNPRSRTFLIWDWQTGTTTESGPIGKQFDIPVIGDYNGDGVDELAAWNPKRGKWHILYASGKKKVKFGKIGDIPVVR